MAKGSKLKSALDRHKGVDHKLEKQKKLQKQAEKRKKSRGGQDVDTDVLDAAAGAEDITEASVASKKSARALGKQKQQEAPAVQEPDKADGWETDGSEDVEDDDDDDYDSEDGGIDLEAIEDDSDSDSEDEHLFQMETDKPNGRTKASHPEDDDEENEDEEDIPLSDIESLASDDRADVVPHQRLTINNTAALTRSLKSFALPPSLPFSAAQAVTSTSPTTIEDVEDDLTRELAFYKQSLEAVKEARIQLKKEGVAFTRPADYFAEMVKSEEQMGKVRAKMLDEAARKKASADARRQRDLKKFGKAVQVAKLQERDKKKRETLEGIKVLKRKRQGGNDLDTNEGDMFDVALEDATETEKKDRAARKASGAAGAGGRNPKRQKKDERFGSGGKRRFKKSNDAQSTGDMRGFSAKKMKAGSKSQRPGKNRRAAGRK